MVDRCTGQNRDGAACAARPLAGTSKCPWHTEGLAEQRRVWSASGGRAKSNTARAKRALPGAAMDADELSGWLAVVFRRLIAGDVEPGVATATASLAKAMIEVARAAHVEDRIAGIEHQLGIERSAS